MNGFRVFNKNKNLYPKNQNVFFIDSSKKLFKAIAVINHDSEITYHVEQCDPNKYIVEFSSGLFDKNNNEIYVGDIIRCGDVDSIITFSDGSFQMITSENQGRSPMLQDRTKRFIIVGNIHIRYMTWEEIIEEHIPCYFWDFEFENDNIGFHQKNFIPGSDEMSRKFKKQYYGGVSDYNHSKPIDPSIIVVEKHEDDVPVETRSIIINLMPSMLKSKD
jgi:hypothetical protein